MVRIGTRDSKLAVWQATTVQHALQALGINSELVFIKSDGDNNLITPLYAMGVEGVFTKALDTALLNNEIDIAVHSMKDVPVQLAQGVYQAAVLQRGNAADIFVWNEGKYQADIFRLISQPANLKKEQIAKGLGYEVVTSSQAMPQQPITLATSSIRRKAQWLHFFPETVMEDIRGNINTRLQKVQDSRHWHGAIFAAAGLERLNIKPDHIAVLDWMLPSPAQGAIIVVCRQSDPEIQQQLAPLNHQQTAICTRAERDFLAGLQGGCSTPISALAQVENGTIHFTGNITGTDGSNSITVTHTAPISEAEIVGKNAAAIILANGADVFVTSLL